MILSATSVTRAEVNRCARDELEELDDELAHEDTAQVLDELQELDDELVYEDTVVAELDDDELVHEDTALTTLGFCFLFFDTIVGLHLVSLS